MNIGAAFRGFFGVDDDYVRPAPANPWPADILIAVVLTVISLSTLMYYQTLEGAPEYVPLVPSLVAICSGGVLIAFRRRFPIGILLVCSGAHFIISGLAVPLAATVTGMQVLYFLGIYTAMAYARRRDTLMLAVIAVLTAMTIWLVLSEAYNPGNGMLVGWWYYVTTVVVNVAFFGAALFIGRQAWLQAKSEDELRLSREVVRLQAEQLAHQAVLAERLRIARDLHDSVAHHISLIGVQTAAARRAMAARPELASGAMQEVEELSRGAVQELRGLLGSLRDIGPDGEGTSLGSLEQLCAEADGPGLRVHYDLVGDPASLSSLTPTQASSLVRITQEALTNVRRHSTADEARVVLRIDEAHVELEVTDNGMPVPGTTGSGLGHVGMRERISALGGQLDIGPRSTQGYRVRTSFPRKASA